MQHHYCYGVVYTPGHIDADGEAMTAHDVAAMAHDFMASGRSRAIDVMHDNRPCGAEVVESFIARKGDPDYPEGAWVLGVRLPEGPLWEAVKAGGLNSFSVEATVLRRPGRLALRPAQHMAALVQGRTEPNLDTAVFPAHRHDFVAEFDRQGRLLAGATDTVLGHSHPVIRPVAVETAMGHSHRFFTETP